MKLKLENTLVRALGPGDYYDSIVRRLVLRVRGKARRYVIRYRKGTVTKRFVLGDATVLSLAEARKRAKKKLGQVDDDGDPQAEKVAERQAAKTGTVAALAVRFVADQGKRWRPKTQTEFERLLEREILPEFGSQRPEDVKRGDVRLWMKAIAETRPTTANRAFEVLRRAYSWAVEEELLQGSPLVGLKKPYEEEPRERTFTDAELVRILAAAPGTTYGGVIPLIVWTGVRSHEARSARWQDIDVRRHVWTIPAKYAKRSRKARAAPRTVPLNAPSLELLRELGCRDIGWVFPAPTRACDTCAEPGHVGKATHPVTVVRRRSGVADFRLHDVRRTVGQRIADEWGTGRMHLALGHARGKLADTYAPAPALRLAREALDWWGEELGALVGTESEAKGRTR